MVYAVPATVADQTVFADCGRLAIQKIACRISQTMFISNEHKMYYQQAFMALSDVLVSVSMDGFPACGINNLMLVV